MLRLALIFFLISVVAALCGFSGVTAITGDAARIFFFVFLVLAILSFFGGLVDEKK